MGAHNHTTTGEIRGCPETTGGRRRQTTRAAFEGAKKRRKYWGYHHVYVSGDDVFTQCQCIKQIGNDTDDTLNNTNRPGRRTRFSGPGFTTLPGGQSAYGSGADNYLPAAQRAGCALGRYDITTWAVDRLPFTAEDTASFAARTRASTAPFPAVVTACLALPCQRIFTRD